MRETSGLYADHSIWKCAFCGTGNAGAESMCSFCKGTRQEAGEYERIHRSKRFNCQSAISRLKKLYD